MAKERIQFNVRLDGRQDLLEAVKAYVANHGLTMSVFVAAALENALEIGVKPKANQLTIPHEQVAKIESVVSQHDRQLTTVIQRLANIEERLVKLRKRQTTA